MAVDNKQATRSQRWDLRVAEHEDELVRAAAAACELNLTGFVRHAAFAEAQRVLADRRRFALSDSDWERFNEMLERPPRVPAGLRKLFSQKSVFED
jgi:uncharacterized protein (DUF1778 family)